MCGIFGIVQEAPVQGRELLEMSRALRHRGPDDEGFLAYERGDIVPLSGPETPAAAVAAALPYAPGRECAASDIYEGGIAFGHRRLSIIDLSPGGHQPMCYDGRYWIVYNGEIYNYRELRDELSGRGCRFLSHSDTEVILAAFQCWGFDCLEHFNGMWAFAIYDAREHSIFLARDRFGVKPLYYWIRTGGSFLFASEIKAFAQADGWRPKINGQRAYDFLAWAMLDHTDETMYEGIYQIPPGHCARLPLRNGFLGALVQGSRIGVSKWYSLPLRPLRDTYEDAVGHYRNLLSESVRLRLRSDVSVGSCLSGGLDSSSIVCLANRFLKESGEECRQKTFSACSEVEKYDERKFIDAVVSGTGVLPHYAFPEPQELLDALPTLIWQQDEPFGSTSIFAQWKVFELAGRNGTTVMLDGQGADECLAGYHGYYGARMAGLFCEGAWNPLITEWKALHRRHGYSHLNIAMRVGAHLLPSINDPVARLMRKESSSLDWLDMARLGAQRRNPIVQAGARASGIQPMSRAQITGTSLPMLLHWEDRNSMAHSIESRVPFLDYRLVEYALGLPDEYKLKHGVTKRILRDAMVSILPDPVRTRTDKLGFVTPEEIWIRHSCTGRFRKLLQQSVDSSRGCLTPAALTLFDSVVEGKREFSFFLWRLMIFGVWMERFGVRPGSWQEAVGSRQWVV